MNNAFDCDSFCGAGRPFEKWPCNIRVRVAIFFATAFSLRFFLSLSYFIILYGEYMTYIHVSFLLVTLGCDFFYFSFYFFQAIQRKEEGNYPI